MGNNLDFNQLCSCVLLLPSLTFLFMHSLLEYCPVMYMQYGEKTDSQANEIHTHSKEVQQQQAFNRGVSVDFVSTCLCPERQ